MAKGKKTTKRETVEIQAPTIEETGDFSSFMNQMAAYNQFQASVSQEQVITTDARSDVLVALSNVLQANAAAVMHLADVANTAPEHKISSELRQYPVE